MSVKMSRKTMSTVAMAMVPNASGETLRARMAVMPSEMTMPEYLASAIQKMPCAISFLTEVIYLISR